MSVAELIEALERLVDANPEAGSAWAEDGAGNLIQTVTYRIEEKAVEVKP